MARPMQSIQGGRGVVNTDRRLVKGSVRREQLGFYRFAHTKGRGIVSHYIHLFVTLQRNTEAQPEREQ
jgi:hypothetical protein